ncbi:MAG: NAD(P)/FAD-dependent oxidoreductase [Burkholderiales bacterium]|nr:NAD(P)/FAD-dependent oxidoreductase [Burkholderiales bacterium]
MPATRAAPRRRQTVIVGGGFAGLWAVRALARADADITLVDRANHHLFQPLLYQVATAGLSAPAIAAPLRHILRRQRNVRVLLAEVADIDLDARRVVLADGAGLDYDDLLVASGAAHAYFGRDDWAPHAPGLKTLDDALEMRRRVLLAFERAEAAASADERAAELHFAVVGGGPTGVELAGTLAEIARHTLRDEFRRIDPRLARVRLIEAGPVLLASFPPALQARTRAQLERLGVEVVTGQPVESIDARGYRLGEAFVPCRTVLWAAGVAASPLGRRLAAGRAADLLDRAGRVRVAPDLSLPGHPEVFVAGDLASLAQADGRPVPGVAPAAKQMGAHAARNMQARAAGRPTAPFRYRDFGNLATIGRMAAVVDLRGLRLSGLPAWWFWLAAHVFFLIGFRNRLMVLIEWAWAYWTYARGARIVLGGTAVRAAAQPPPVPQAPEVPRSPQPPPRP